HHDRRRRTTAGHDGHGVLVGLDRSAADPGVHQPLDQDVPAHRGAQGVRREHPGRGRPRHLRLLRPRRRGQEPRPTLARAALAVARPRAGRRPRLPRLRGRAGHTRGDARCAHRSRSRHRPESGRVGPRAVGLFPGGVPAAAQPHALPEAGRPAGVARRPLQLTECRHIDSRRAMDDLRIALQRLASAGALQRVTTSLHWQYELAAVLWKLQHGPTVLFENVDGYDTPVVGNLLNTRDKLAIALDIGPDEVQPRVVHALNNPIEPTVVDEAPWLDVQHPGDVDLTDILPIPVISERDAGRYISAGVLICKDPETGRRNMAICRMQAQGPGQIGVYLAPTHSRGFLQTHRARGTKMDVAVAIGLHPGLLVASQLLTPLDETHVAGGIFQQPVPLARARTVDVEVPTGAEIVLEGVIDPAEEETEGPFGEFPGTYAPQRKNPVIRLTAVSTRERPIFQMIVGGRHPEHLVTGAIAREAGLFNAIRSVIPGVRRVLLTEGGT